jgi:hypothetical protein
MQPHPLHEGVHPRRTKGRQNRPWCIAHGRQHAATLRVLGSSSGWVDFVGFGSAATKQQSKVSGGTTQRCARTLARWAAAEALSASSCRVARSPLLCVWVC